MHYLATQKVTEKYWHVNCELRDRIRNLHARSGEKIASAAHQPSQPRGALPRSAGSCSDKLSLHCAAFALRCVSLRKAGDIFLALPRLGMTQINQCSMGQCFLPASLH